MFRARVAALRTGLHGRRGAGGRYCTGLWANGAHAAPVRSPAASSLRPSAAAAAAAAATPAAAAAAAAAAVRCRRTDAASATDDAAAAAAIVRCRRTAAAATDDAATDDAATIESNGRVHEQHNQRGGERHHTSRCGRRAELGRRAARKRHHAQLLHPRIRA